MNINNDNINKISNTTIVSSYKTQQNVQNKSNVVSNMMLPSVYPVGQSQINKSLPVSYKKIGEISVPGLKEKAKIYKLENGQRVIIAPKKGPTYIRTTYNVGSMNEPDNIRGMSHFIEHNLFNGSKNLAPKEYDKKVSDLGGGTNASTGFAVTDYYINLQLLDDTSLEEAIKLNAEQTQFPIFPNEQLKKEKEPVKSEIDMCNDNANTVAVCKMLKNLFKVQTKSPDFVIGTKENINSFTRDKVLEYYNTWYTPDNAVTVITGDVDSDETINLVAKYYNKQNDYSNIKNRYYEKIQYNEKPVREDIIKSNTTLPSIVMGFAIPEGTSEEEIHKIDVLFNMMNSSDSTLYKALDKLGASINFSIENMQNKPQGAKAIIINANAPEEKIEDTIKIIYSEITKISNYPPATDELNNIKQSMTNNILASSESSSTLNLILTNAALTNNYECYNSSIQDVQKILPSDITQTAKKYLNLNKVSMCVSHDMNTNWSMVENNYAKSKQISFGAKNHPIDNLKEENKKISHVKLSNNIESTIIPGNSNAKSSICINLNSDDLNKTTHAELMILNELLNRGSKLKGVEKFNSILNSKDISIVSSTGIDGILISAECNSEKIEDTMKLIKENIMYPNFTREEFIKAKQLVKESMETEIISAEDKFYKELQPEIKIYEDKETRLKELEKITLTDIQNLYLKIMKSSSCNALISVPEGRSDLIQAFNQELKSDMPKFRPHTLKKDEKYNIYKPNLEKKVLTTEREQAQAEVLQGYKFKKLDNIDDIAKINLMNIILGSSGMSSRLFTDLRENQKLAYHVGSGMYEEKDTGVLLLMIDTTTESADNKEGAPENITKALEGFNKNINLLKTEKVSEKELNDAKKIYKRRILDEMETNAGKSKLYMKLLNTYYGTGYNEKLFEAIDKVTVEDIKMAADYVFKNPPVISVAASKKTLTELNI